MVKQVTNSGVDHSVICENTNSGRNLVREVVNVITEMERVKHRALGEHQRFQG